MSWFQTTNIASLAKTALKEAQKTIDKALDIKEEDGQGQQRSAANPPADGVEGGRNAGVGVGSTVSDMASEFFASWGVSAGLPVPGSRSKPGSTTNTSSSSSNNASPTRKNVRAISTPPKRSPQAVQDLILEDSQLGPASQQQCLSRDVPVTLLPTGAAEENGVEIHPPPSLSDHQTSTKYKHQTHTRSLSDTVFHASDNLEGLVQVLDDSSGSTSVTLESDPLSFSFLTSAPASDAVLQSPSREVLKLHDEKSEDVRLLSTKDKNPSSSASVVREPAEVNVRESESASLSLSNVELLQEIDLDGCGGGGGGGLPVEEGSRDNEVNNVIASSSNLNVVESFALSDGWDWTASTDSCLLLPDKLEEDKDPDPEEDIQVTSNSNFDLGRDLLGTSAETLKPEHEQEDKTEDEVVTTTLTLAPTPITPNPEEEVEIEDQDPSLLHPPSSPVPPIKTERIPSPSSPSSRPPSPDADADPGGPCSSPPSSARVSPNFEMVSSGCIVPGGTLPESSRSSSIVVVSGRESTPNSRGTSGAGSSGSSEGGHDLVDGPHSPAQTQEYPRKTSKHKKGASSSSSSDIEVIPSDYSNSSSSKDLQRQVLTLDMDKSSSRCDREIQTDPPERSQAQVQTDNVQVPLQNPNEGEEVATPVPQVDPQDISKYVSNEVADMLLEKEQEVQQLRAEGEKLSLKQFELSQTIKKIRAKEKETEGVMKGLRTEIATKNLELEKLMKTFISKEGIEQSQNETISKLNQERRRLELKVEEMSSELEDARDNVDSMKATVENASIEILELKNVISSVQRESAEVDRLTKDKAELISRTDSLQKEVDHLRSALNTSQSSHHTREASLKSQISTLTHKLHTLETRLSDISSEVADATMPLSMEIEKLQSELKQQHLQSDRREQVLHSTITDLESKLRSAQDKERAAKDLQIEFQSQHSTLELRIDELESTNRALKDKLQQTEDKLGKKLEDKSARCQRLEKTVERLTGEVERLSSENDLLSSELKAERSSLEVERRRLINQNFSQMEQQQQPPRLHQQQHQQGHQRSSSMSTTASNTSTTVTRGGRNDNSPRSREHSPSEHSITSEEASYLDEVFDPGNGNRSMTPKSFFESFSSAGLIESLQNQLRLREGEVVAFQEELGKNEKIRKQLNEEIANLTMHNQQLALEMEKLAEMEQKLEALDKNYNAVLQMYGEKVEEADELRMDLEDVKEMYKTQIEQLLKKT